MSGVDLWMAVTTGIFLGALSASVQLASPVYMDFISYKGFFNYDKSKHLDLKGYIGKFFTLEVIIFLLPITIFYHAAEFAYGIPSSFNLVHLIKDLIFCGIGTVVFQGSWEAYMVKLRNYRNSKIPGRNVSLTTGQKIVANGLNFDGIASAKHKNTYENSMAYFAQDIENKKGFYFSNIEKKEVVNQFKANLFMLMASLVSVSLVVPAVTALEDKAVLVTSILTLSGMPALILINRLNKKRNAKSIFVEGSAIKNTATYLDFTKSLNFKTSVGGSCAMALN